MVQLLSHDFMFLNLGSRIKSSAEEHFLSSDTQHFRAFTINSLFMSTRFTVFADGSNLILWWSSIYPVSFQWPYVYYKKTPTRCLISSWKNHNYLKQKDFVQKHHNSFAVPVIQQENLICSGGVFAYETRPAWLRHKRCIENKIKNKAIAKPQKFYVLNGKSFSWNRSSQHISHHDLIFNQSLHPEIIPLWFLHFCNFG